MNETDKTKLSDQTKFRLNEMKKIGNYFLTLKSIKEISCKKLSKYVTTFNYIDKILIVSNVTTGRVCIISNATVVAAPVGTASAGFTIIFSIATGIIKKLLKTTKNKKRTSMIKFLCWLKVNSIALKL